MSSRRRQRGQIRSNRRLWNIGQRSKARTRRFRWIRKFSFKLYLGIGCLFLLFEIFMLPIFSIFSGDTKNPKETALIQQRLEEAHDQEKKLQIDYRWVLLGNLPQTVRRDVLIAKDARFYSPAGIDWHEVWK